MDERIITIEVNGKQYRLKVPVRENLADFLRHRLHLTGTHTGCEHGVCGSCTILLDSRSVRSCLILAVQCDGRSVRTVESLADTAGKLDPLQDAFSRHHALQCGFCTPGVLMTLVELRENADPSEINEDMIREKLSGNLCRCTGYQGMVDAALETLSRPDKRL
jgi:carbon-monoxide dehydrogenase small subunit